MTRQYPGTNINDPRFVREVSGGGTFALTTDDGLVVVTAGVPTLALPDARTVPGVELFIKSVPGTGTVTAILGQLIDAAPIFTFTTPQQALFVKSSNAGWRIISDGLGGGGGALAVEDEGILVDAATTLMNFVGGGVVASPAGAGAVDITIPGAGLLSGAPVPEGVIPGTSGDPYIRISGVISSFWQFQGAAPGVFGWQAIGPRLMGVPVGVINGLNTIFTFPGGSEAVHQTPSPGAQILLEHNGVEQTEGVDFTVVAGVVPGTTISAIVFTIAPIVADLLKTTFIPA